MVVLTRVVGEVALMVVPMQIGIGGFSFEEVVIGIFVDSQILYFPSLVSREVFCEYGGAQGCCGIGGYQGWEFCGTCGACKTCD